MQRKEDLPETYRAFTCGEEVEDPTTAGNDRNDCDKDAVYLVTEKNGQHVAYCALHAP